MVDRSTRHADPSWFSKLIDMFCAKGLRFCLMVKKNECFHIGCGVNKKPPIDDAAALLWSVSLVF